MWIVSNSLVCVSLAFFLLLPFTRRNWTLDIAGFLQSRVIYCSPIINYLVKNHKGTSNSANDDNNRLWEWVEERGTEINSIYTYTYNFFLIFVKLVPLFHLINTNSFEFFSLLLFLFGSFWVKDIKIDRVKKNRSVYERRDSPIFHVCVWISMFTSLYYTRSKSL